MTPVRGPAVPRRRLGTELRRLREDAGFTLEQVAQQLECSTSKVSRLETGNGIPRVRDVRDMLDFYGARDQRLRDRVFRWVREGQQQGWWDTYSGVLDRKWQTFIGLEADAESMRAYETTVVHGLLQTADYTRAIAQVILRGHRAADLDQFVELRGLRQGVLAREEGALRLHVIMEEAAVYRPVGGEKIMRGQWRHLLRMADHPAVTLQVLGLGIGAHSAMGTSFALLTFPDAADHGVIYAEGVGGAVIVEHEKDFNTYAEAFEEISTHALGEAQSKDFIAGILQGSD